MNLLALTPVALFSDRRDSLDSWGIAGTEEEGAGEGNESEDDDLDDFSMPRAMNENNNAHTVAIEPDLEPPPPPPDDAQVESGEEDSIDEDADMAALASEIHSETRTRPVA